MKLLLVINVNDDVAEDYKDFTVDYDLRGTLIDDDKVNESIKYVEDADVRLLPRKLEELEGDLGQQYLSLKAFNRGWNACLDTIIGETK